LSPDLGKGTHSGVSTATSVVLSSIGSGFQPRLRG
jgi:hypothetical protein